jgi:TolA-binding protein
VKPIYLFGLVLLVFSTLGASCKTKRDIRRDQEYERIKAEVREARGARADLEVISDEFRTELARLSSAVEEQSQAQRLQSEEFHKELSALSAKVQTLEQQVAVANSAPPPRVQKAPSYEAAKELFDAGQFEEAAEEAKGVVRAKGRGASDSKKSQFLLAEAYFAAKDFGAAALEFSEFKKAYAKDPNVANATLRQAQCFRNLGKEKEAKLFYQELIEKFPKSPAAGQAKKELKKLK